MTCWRLKMLGVVCALYLLSGMPVTAQTSLLPIGAIQGAGDVSPYLNRFVNFRGVVVGRFEDENTRGDVYYTIFVQDLPDLADGDPATSDGIAVFLGREHRPDIPLGSQVVVGGKVTEFYGLTEIDDNGLVLSVEELSGPPVTSINIDPPADVAEQLAYFEAFESMRVSFDGPVVVSGPTHTGCGFAVVDEAGASELPVARRLDGDPTGRVVPILYPSDLNCDAIPQVKVGDRLDGLAGVLTYNFDQFKIIIDAADQLELEPSAFPAVPSLIEFGPDQIVLATINAEDYFDTIRHTDEEGEPVLTGDELGSRQAKLAYLISRVLHCPSLVALQEVENEQLLADLSAVLSDECPFVYQVSHLDSPDARGIDNALISDSRRVNVLDVALRQECSPVPTGIIDRSLVCDAPHEPLFGRPPLQVRARIDGRLHTIFVNHFKSKRGGEVETDLERIRQAIYLNGLAAELLASDPDARIIALGDFNDTDLSPAITLLTDPAQDGRFYNALSILPPDERYTYNFGGVVELIDMILMSPALVGEIGYVTVLHVNTDYPIGWRTDTSPGRMAFRISDHDIPVLALGAFPDPTPEPTAIPTEKSTQPPTIEVASVTAIPTPAASRQSPAATRVILEDSAEAAVRHPRQTGLGWIIPLIGIVFVGLVVLFVIRFRH